MAEDWSDTDVELLRRLWREGLSGGAIANRIGKSRNSVIGKAHRLFLAKRPSRGNSRPHRARARPSALRLALPAPNSVAIGTAPALPVPLPQPIIALPLPPIPGEPLFLLRLKDGLCKFAIGTIDGQHHFCGAETGQPDLSWCPYHLKLITNQTWRQR